MRDSPGAPFSSPSARSRPAWGWRLAIYTVLLVLVTLSLTALLVAVAGFDAAAGLSLSGVGVAVAAAVAVSWVMMSKVESRSPAALGLVFGRRGVTDFVHGSAIGVSLVGLVCLAMLAAGWLDTADGATVGLGKPGATVYVTFVLLLAAFLEELLIRGYPFQVLAEARGPVVAIGATALVFGALHGANPGVGWTALGNTILAGILLGVMYWRTFSLWLVTGTHLAWNWTMGVVFGLPVSGLNVDAARAPTRVGGPETLTGGEYGPEGGLLLGLVTLIGILWTVRTPRLSRDPAVLALAPLPEKRIRNRERPGHATGDSARIELEAT